MRLLLQRDFGDDFIAQHILLMEDLPPEQQRLIRRILALAQHRKYTRRDKLADFYQHYDELERRARSSGIEITDQDLRQYVWEYASSPGVEIGVWLLGTGKGVYVAFHTSSQRGQIEGADFESAINGLLASHKLTLLDLREVRYFHNHPYHGPLTAEDVNTMKTLRAQLRSHSPNLSRLQIYAIDVMEGTPIIFTERF